MAETIPTWMTTEQVAEYTQYPTETLSRWRKEGRGPKYSKPIHGIRYHRDDVDEWMRSDRASERRSS